MKNDTQNNKLDMPSLRKNIIFKSIDIIILVVLWMIFTNKFYPYAILLHLSGPYSIVFFLLFLYSLRFFVRDWLK